MYPRNRYNIQVIFSEEAAKAADPHGLYVFFTQANLPLYEFDIKKSETKELYFKGTASTDYTETLKKNIFDEADFIVTKTDGKDTYLVDLTAAGRLSLDA